MPELPEVESFRKLAESVARGRKISSVVCADDPIVYDGVSPKAFARALGSRTVAAVERVGKQLYFVLDRRPWPVFHFGMTGSFRVASAPALELASHPGRSDDAWPPKFTKLHIHFDDGGELVMTNARRLGRIRLRQNPLGEPPLCELGFDPLTDMPNLRTFRGLLRARRGNVKGLLLDQSFAAGVGNWIADEVLYQSRIAPQRSVASLSANEEKHLHHALKNIIRKAASVDADKKRFPKGWLFHRRWGKPESAVTVDGKRIEFVRVAGRTTAWVPDDQR